MDVAGRKALSKFLQDRLRLLLPRFLFEVLAGARKNSRVCRFFVQPKDKVINFIDQPHRIDVARLYTPLGILRRLPHLVDLLREDAGRTKIGKDDIAAGGEQARVELVTLPRRAADVEVKEGPRPDAGPLPAAVARQDRKLSQRDEERTHLFHPA